MATFGGYHRYSIDACDLVFGENKDLKPAAAELLALVELIEHYFEAEKVHAAGVVDLGLKVLTFKN